MPAAYAVYTQPRCKKPIRVSQCALVTTLARETSSADPHAGQSLFDKLGIGVSLTCAVHCVITALLSLLPTMGFSAIGGAAMEWLELPLLLGALGVGLFALVPTFLREHKDARPISLFATGIAFVGASRAFSGMIETGLTVVGVVFVASAHVVNLRLHAAHHAKA
jgi:hypothetical protein